MARLTTLKPRIQSQAPRLNTIQPDSWRAGKTSTARGYGYKWQKARERYLQEHPLCVMCLANNITAVATVVDHIEPHRGNEELFWDENNWQGLCATCHSSTKAKQEHEQGKR